MGINQAYLVSLYLDCPPGMGIHCPNDDDRARFADAVHRGDIYWHAFPHNAQVVAVVLDDFVTQWFPVTTLSVQVEVMDSWLLEYGVALVHDLDTAFGLPLKSVMSQRDVPGLTRAAVPYLAGQGVTTLTVGVNGGSAPPGVPKNQPFWWRDGHSGTQLLAFWHPGGADALFSRDGSGVLCCVQQEQIVGVS